MVQSLALPLPVLAVWGMKNTKFKAPKPNPLIVYYLLYGLQSYRRLSVSTFYHTPLSSNPDSCITKVPTVNHLIPSSLNFHPPPLLCSPKIVADSGLMLIYLNIYTSEEAIFSTTLPEMKSFIALPCTSQFQELGLSNFLSSVIYSNPVVAPYGLFFRTQKEMKSSSQSYDYIITTGVFILYP